MKVKFPGLREYCEELSRTVKDKRKAKKLVYLKFPEASEPIVFANMKPFYKQKINDNYEICNSTDISNTNCLFYTEYDDINNNHYNINIIIIIVHVI